MGDSRPTGMHQSDTRAEAIDRMLAEAIESGRFRGLSFAAVDNAGGIIYSGAHGLRDFNTSSEPMTIDTAGWMASATKLLTSVSVMQVVERGLIGLDDDWKHQKVLASYDEHTGTERFTPLQSDVSLRGFTYDQWNENLTKWAHGRGKIDEAARGDLPGSGWAYGSGIDWAGRVVEVLSKQTLEEYMQTNIWSPLGMANTTFHPEKRLDFPMLHMGIREQNNNEVLSPSQSPWPVPATDDLGGAGLCSTAEDYAKLLSSLLADDGPILRRESIMELIRPQLSGDARQDLERYRGMGVVQIDIPNSVPVDHGLGGLVVLNDIPEPRKAGSMNWDGMSNPQWMLDRSSGLICTLFTQVLPCPDIATKELWAALERIIYQEHE